MTKDLTNATAEMQNAIAIRKEYEALGTMENKDILQQIMNLISFLIRAKDFEHAASHLDFYEQTITQYEGCDTFDYGSCHLYFLIL